MLGLLAPSRPMLRACRWRVRYKFLRSSRLSDHSRIAIASPAGNSTVEKVCSSLQTDNQEYGIGTYEINGSVSVLRIEEGTTQLVTGV